MENKWVNVFLGFTIVGIIADLIWMIYLLLEMLATGKFNFLFLGLIIGVVYLISQAVFIRATDNKFIELSHSIDKGDRKIRKMEVEIDDLEKDLYDDSAQ
jgi:hypothetical protein